MTEKMNHPDIISAVDDENKVFIGRKLYIRWGENTYIAIEKVPNGSKKLAEIELTGSNLMLCNMFEDIKTGQISEEILGAPSNTADYHRITQYATDNTFWMTPSEAHDPSIITELSKIKD